MKVTLITADGFKVAHSVVEDTRGEVPETLYTHLRQYALESRGPSDAVYRERVRAEPQQAAPVMIEGQTIEQWRDAARDALSDANYERARTADHIGMTRHAEQQRDDYKLRSEWAERELARLKPKKRGL